MNAIAAMLLVSSALASTPSDIAQELSSARIQRVGVVPRVLQRVDGREVIAEQLGPNAELIAQKFSAALADVARTRYQGRLTVVSHRVMRSAFDKLSPEALGDLNALQEIGRRSQANALVIVYVADKGNTLEETYEIVPVSGDSAGEVQAKQTSIKTIADYAYMGGSFEARRWINGELVPVGLTMSVQSPNVPFSALKQDQPHPLQRADFPYGIELVMRDRDPQPEFVGKDMYVPMNENEAYGIRVWNHSARPVYMALYIDGINTIGKELENSTETPIKRLWYIKPSQQPSVITGYLTVENRQSQSSEQFMTADSSRSLAAERGFTDRLGLVTAVFFDYIPQQAPGEYQKALPRLGTQAGERTQVRVDDWGTGLKGDLLTAMTVRYATQEEIDDYKVNGSPLDPDPINNNVAPRKPIVPGQGVPQPTIPGQVPPYARRPVPAPDDTGNQASIAPSRDPDESVPFPRSGVASVSSDPKR